MPTESGDDPCNIFSVQDPEISCKLAGVTAVQARGDPGVQRPTNSEWPELQNAQLE